MRIYKKWVGQKPDCAGDIYVLECSQEEQFTQMFPLIGQQALHATSGRDVIYRLYLICEDGRRILPIDKPSVMMGAFNGGRSPLADCEVRTAEHISELVNTDELRPSMEASRYLTQGAVKE